MQSDGSLSVTWRVSLWVRVLLPLLGVLLVWLGLTDPDPAFGLALALAGPLGIWLFGFRPRVTLDSTELTVVNPLGTRRLIVHEITEAVPGYLGLENRSGDRVVTAWAVQQMNISTLLMADTRASRVAAQILDRAGQAPR